MFKFYTGNKINISLQETSENSFLLNKTVLAYVLINFNSPGWLLQHL